LIVRSGRRECRACIRARSKRVHHRLMMEKLASVPIPDQSSRKVFYIGLAKYETVNCHFCGNSITDRVYRHRKYCDKTCQRRNEGRANHLKLEATLNNTEGK
jgi:hypothetical protein